MGIYVNPGNSGFQRILEDSYVDKTGLISIINHMIGTPRNLTCVSRPRRFGKSFAAQMLCAYYDRTCDSSALFEKYEIAKDKTYEKHLNQYNILYLDMTNILGKLTDADDFISFIQNTVTDDLLSVYPSEKKEMHLMRP